MNFLVVDDAEDVRRMLTRNLARMGYEPHAVASGAEALAHLKTNGHIDLVLLDYSMPDMDGMETFWRIRKDWPDLPVVMVTAFESTHLAVEFMRGGGDMFMVKPVNFDVLELVIKEVTEKARFRRKYRETQRALKASEAHARAVFEASVDGIITIGRDGVIRQFNPAAEGMFDYAAGEVIGRNVTMLMPQHLRPEHEARLKAYRSKRSGIIGGEREMVGLKKNGKSFPIELRVSEMRVGGETLFLGTCTDISARKAAENLNTWLGRIIEQSINEIYVIDARTLRLRQANRGSQENLGFTLEELEKLTPLDLMPDFTRRKFRALVRPLRDGRREEVAFETVHGRKDGTTYDVGVRVQYMGSETPPVFVAVIQDITERKRAEKDLRESEAKFRAIVEGESIIGTYILQRNGEAGTRLVYASPKFCEIAGYPQSGLGVGTDLVAPEDRSLVRNNIDRRFAGDDNASTYSYRLLRRDGTRAPVQAHNGLTTLKGKPVMIGILRSMTAEQEAGERARRAEIARAAAERATNAKSEFLANMSHELRTPLSAILGFAEQAEKQLDGGDIDGTRRHLSRVVANSDRLAEVIHSVLDLSKVEAGEEHFHFVRLDLGEIVREAISDLHSLVQKRRLSVRLINEIGPTREVVCDGNHIGRVVLNLLSNASKFADEGSSIDIRLWKEEESVWFSIADEGLEIPDHELETIFEPFRQSSRTDKGLGGTGLGLALCKRIVEAHGGEIRAHMDDERHTVFTFSLPLGNPGQQMADEENVRWVSTS